MVVDKRDTLLLKFKYGSLINLNDRKRSFHGFKVERNSTVLRTHFDLRSLYNFNPFWYKFQYLCARKSNVIDMSEPDLQQSLIKPINHANKKTEYVTKKNDHN